MGKLINRQQGLCLLLSSLPGLALITHVESARQASRCQQAFLKPCLVNLISKDTNPVFSIFHMQTKIVSEYDQEIPQSQTSDNHVAPRGRAAQPSRDTRKTTEAKQPALSSPSR